jgi:hypothetical protein
MPAKSEKQRKFFGAVLSCKKTGKCSKSMKKKARKISVKAAKEFMKKSSTMLT